MGQSSKSMLGSPSPDKRKAEDELETVNPKKKIICLIASIKEDVSSIKVVVDSLKEDVASLKATVNSLKSTFDLLSTKKDSLAIFTSFKETARIPASVKNIVRPVIQNSASSEDLKISDQGEEPAHKKAKTDTNTCKKESSRNVSSKESDVVKKETLERTLPTYSFKNLTKTAEVGERALFIPKQGGRYDCGTIFVKGYDSSLGENDLARALLEHFSPCGMISRIYFQTNDAGEAVLKHVFIVMLQGTEDALKLNGSDMGGCNLEVHDATERDEFYVNYEVSGGPFIKKPCQRLLARRKYTRENPPVYGIVSSSKINK
ncbi:unnamed protein product [Arabidopsis thaliana]|uniref:RNA-binding (RRM/RBD/RNP motifs) family protein n=2 Tax=Arabidopsis thaliana TaxID=3702 RepID=F4KDD0_ARATH|nr:RNA-binding (RRM/RBD/RNP motifs) family protein [Arabidopsis thaliana]AED96120.1 RNA-binding (RRM/RBD/RNP motifs) family protein [Arabidopsis thaliana]VYS70035.1 unnamed protein product [Arabidopsis thaliana]|eukprot:NP_199986.2 RNA-binding (RRM/RBD/RNP motifs) family protein [Arabidopsis thaliana]